jgi:hypothetical protein
LIVFGTGLAVDKTQLRFNAQKSTIPIGSFYPPVPKKAAHFQLIRLLNAPPHRRQDRLDDPSLLCFPILPSRNILGGPLQDNG